MTTKLHTQTTGRGPDLFLIHGWALHSGVWSGIVPELARNWRVTCVDLPGHGRSRGLPMPATLPELARLVVQAAPQRSVWLGWSLGGLVALRAALDFPERIAALVLVSATPRFVSAADWPCAMPPAKLTQFMAELETDYFGTLARFLGLQVRGGEHAHDTLRQLQAALRECDAPQAVSLTAGLEILRAADLRAAVSQLALPVLILAGDYDRLTPPAAGAWLAGVIGAAHLVRLPKAAHAPFISHAQQFLEALQDFLTELATAKASAARTARVHHG